MSRRDVDVLVVGGGPAGAAAGYWLAKQGHDVTIVEKRTFPRDKTCGDALTPRAVQQLADMGLTEELSTFHRYSGLRVTGAGKSIELEWPAHPMYPQHGYVARRRELDALVARAAEAAGARLLQGHEAIAPVVDRGFVRGAVVRSTTAGFDTAAGGEANDDDGSDELDALAASDDSSPRGLQRLPLAMGTDVDADPSRSISEIHARYVVVADGANSRFGRALGTFRSREMAYGTAIRGYWASPLHADRWIESALDLKDRGGNSLPGYGWVFPVGDGTVNLGVGLLSTFREFKSVNTSHLLDSYVQTVADRWGLDPEASLAKPLSGRIPMGGSVGPKVGPTYLVVGDAAGSVNPFNGEGIDYAYETGRLAAQVLHHAITDNDPLALQTYDRQFEATYGQYFRVARLFAKVIGRPALMRELTRAGMQSRSLMEWMLRIMANLLRPDEVGVAEAVYKAAAQITRAFPG